MVRGFTPTGLYTDGALGGFLKESRLICRFGPAFFGLLNAAILCTVRPGLLFRGAPPHIHPFTSPPPTPPKAAVAALAGASQAPGMQT